MEFSIGRTWERNKSFKVITMEKNRIELERHSESADLAKRTNQVIHYRSDTPIGIATLLARYWRQTLHGVSFMSERSFERCSGIIYWSHDQQVMLLKQEVTLLKLKVFPPDLRSGLWSRSCPKFSGFFQNFMKIDILVVDLSLYQTNKQTDWLTDTQTNRRMEVIV